MKKRNRIVLAFIAPAILLAASLASKRVFAQPAAVPPAHLRCEYLDNPMGVDTPHPRFFWWLDQSARGAHQTAYQILVASSPELLARGQGDQWDSGKVQSADTTQIAYAGKPLASGKDYYWQVRTWEGDGNPGPYSAPAHFSMGLLAPGDWKGAWIGGGAADGNEFRKAFALNGKIVRARVYVTALGYYELHINGRKIGHAVLDPAWTTYPRRVLYSTYDVTDALRGGQNAVGVMLGGGWATLSEPANHIQAYYKSPALLLDMQIEMADGKTITIASDGSWKTTRGPVVEDSVYDGEVYDARLETHGWDAPGFDDAKWPSATVVEGSDGVRSSEMMPPIRVVDTLVPRSVTSPEPGVYVFDMGQNMSGWAQLRVSGPAGTKVTLRYAELVYPNGMINRENLRGAKSRDVYILKGSGPETYEPRFTYHGFRYVEVTGYPGTPGIDSIRGRLVHSAVDQTGNFLASRQILNNLQNVILWSQRTNLFGVPTDCDQRDERQGWMGDAQITAEEAMMNFNMAAFYTNFLRDMRDAQGADGALPATVPHKYGDAAGDLGWETAYPIIAWTMWTHYADRRVLEENEPDLKKYVEFLRTHAVGNVFQGYLSHEGDWVELEHTPLDFMADIWYYYDVDLMARIESVLGNSSDAATYSQLASQIRDALNKRYLNAETGEYANGTQTANAMALYMNLPPAAARSRVASHLYNDVVYFHNTHTTSGFIGIRYLLPALTSIGSPNVAYELATEETYPSWGYMLKNGATTLWELWQKKTGPSMNSQDHIMFGSVGAWFYQALAGIDQAPDSAGYAHIRIAPQTVEDLTWASGTIQTVHGVVTSSWQRTLSSIKLHVTIPPGSDAQVLIPVAPDWTGLTVKENGHVVWDKDSFVPGDAGVSAAQQDRHGVTFTVASGDYTFDLTAEP